MDSVQHCLLNFFLAGESKVDQSKSLNNIISWAIQNVDGIVTLPNGAVMDRMRLAIYAVDLWPLNSFALNTIGTQLRRDEFATLLDGRKMNRQELFLEGYRVDNTCESSLYNLTFTLQSSLHETVQLSDGRCMNSKQLLEAVIKLQPRCANAYLALGAQLNPDENWTFAHNGVTVSGQKDAFVKSIICNPHQPEAYTYLAACLDGPEDTICLPDRVWYDQRLLVQKSIKNCPNYWPAWLLLAILLQPEETFESADSKDLCIKVLNIAGYREGLSDPFSSLLVVKDTDNEVSMFRKACFTRNTDIFAVQCLKNRLFVDESVTLANGTIISSARNKRNKTD